MSERSPPAEELYQSLHAAFSHTVRRTALAVGILYTAAICAVAVVESAPVGVVLLAGALSSVVALVEYVVLVLVSRLALRVVTKLRLVRRLSALASLSRAVDDDRRLPLRAALVDAFGPHSHAAIGFTMLVGATLFLLSSAPLRLDLPILTTTGDYVPVFSVLVGVLLLLAGRALLSFETFRATVGRIGVLMVLGTLLGGAIWAADLAFSRHRDTTEFERSVLFSAGFLALVRGVGSTVIGGGPPRRVARVVRAYTGRQETGASVVGVIRTSRWDPDCGTSSGAFPLDGRSQ